MAMTEAEVLEASEEQLAKLPNYQLAEALRNSFRVEARRKIMEEVHRRKAANDLLQPFNPRIDVSADAQFLWKRIFIWFWVVPVVLGIIALLTRR